VTTPCDRKDDIIEMKSDIKSIRVLLQGNGKMGVSTMAHLAYDYMIQKKNDKHDMFMVAYRIIMGIGLAYIAVKLGLK